MTVQRTVAKTVFFLLELIDNLMKDEKKRKSLGDTCEEIKEWFEEKKDWFSKLNHFDDKLMEEIAYLAQVIDNASYGDPKQDAEHGQGIVNAIDNASYGDPKQDAEHGQGIVNAIDNASYGDPKQDAEHGQGIVNAIDNAGYGDPKQDAEHGQDGAGTPDAEPYRGIKEVFNRIKDLILQISLDKCEMPPTKEEAQSEGQKFSKDWLELGIEESILESPAMATLELSYTILDLHLKMCLLCFAIFPEKAIIKKRSLIYWWIGEGFVRKTKTKTAEEAGEEAFIKLIDMGLINPEYKKAMQNKKENPVIDSCTMHPWIRRMVITVAKKAEFFDLDRRGEPTGQSSQSRRICFGKDVRVDQSITPPTNANESEDQQTSSTWFERDQKYQLPFITLFNIDRKRIEIKEEWFSRLNRVSVLQLGRWQHKADHHVEVENQVFLKHLGALTHLKYLSLRGMSSITELPSSVLNLVLLQILDLRACHNLEKLPSDVSSLRRLTHLDVSECYLLESMPKGLDKLFSLQVLKGFVIETSRRSSGGWVNLSRLKNLRKLSIYIGSQDLTQERELYSLKDMENLRVLTITWKEVKKVERSSQFKEVKGSSQSEEVPEKPFSFPPKLEKLDLRCIPFDKQPEWLKPSFLTSLKSLYIRGGKLDGSALEADQKWMVKNLRLKYLYDFRPDWQRIIEDFPYLKYYEKIKFGEHEEKAVDDEVWRKYDSEEEEMSEENNANETKPVAQVQGEEKEPGALKERPVQDSSEIAKQAKAGKDIAEESEALGKGDDNQEPNKVEDQKASSSKVLTNEPNFTSTSVGKEEIKPDTMVKESKELEKQGDNDQVLNKVEDLGGSINNLIPNESRLVAPVMNG